MSNLRFQKKLRQFYAAALFDFPFAATELMMLGGSNRTGVNAAGWRAYDAWVAAANEIANDWFTTPSINRPSLSLAVSHSRSPKPSAAPGGQDYRASLTAGSDLWR